MNRSAISVLSSLLVLAAGSFAFGQIALPGAGEIGTIAGNGTAGYSGDGGAATGAEMNQPSGVAVDASGNVYVADLGNNVVRMIAAGTGTISTVAGDGQLGWTGDGGAATSARLNQPRGVAVDAVGDLFIADYGNNAVREVAGGTGVISTVAGTGAAGYSGDGAAATSAQLNEPYGVAVDAAGDLFIADMGNYRVREVAVGTGVITTVAGNGVKGYVGDGGDATSAEVMLVGGVAVDASGNLYIADHGVNVVRKVAAGTGVISTVVGTGFFGFSGDGGQATAAQLDSPYGLAVDASGDLFIADSTNNRVREVFAGTGVILTVAGDGTAGFNGDGGLAPNAEVSAPFGVAVDAAGDLFIGDLGNNRVRAVGGGVVVPSYTVTVTSSDMAPTVGELVTLTATIVDQTGTPVTAGTVTWGSGTSTIGMSAVSGGVATIVTTLGQLPSQVIEATYASGTPDQGGSGSLTLTVVGFSIAGTDTSSVTITAGQSGTVAISLASFNGFAGTVSLSCSGVPTPGTCSLSDSSVSLGGGTTSQSVTLTVQTAVASATTTSAVRREGALGIALAVLCPVFLLGGRRRIRILVVVAGAALSLGLAGCGGSGGGTKTTTPATVTYAVTVVAKSGNIQVSMPITVTVE